MASLLPDGTMIAERHLPVATGVRPDKRRLASRTIIAAGPDHGAAWPSFSLIAAYELLMRQIRRAAESRPSRRKCSQAGRQ